ncbi:MAG: outer membrane beta-barrel protein [Saprospiraceae bacterium]
MQKLIIIISLLFCGILLNAQTDSIAIDTIPNTPELDSLEQEKKERDFKIVIGENRDSSNNRVRTRYVMLDYGISTYLHKGKMNLPSEYENMEQQLLGSNQWNFIVVAQRIALDKKRRVNLKYGVGFEFNKYKFQRNHTMQEEQNEVTFINTTTNFTKNNLNATYLKIPIILQYRIKPKNINSKIKIGIGGYAGLLIASKLKQKSEDFGKQKFRDDFNLNRTKAGLTARVGIGVFNLYVDYGLTDLFRKDQNGGLDLQPLSFGISIIPF